MWAIILDFSLQEIGAKQACLIPKVSLAVATYIKKKPLKRDFIGSIFKTGKRFVDLFHTIVSDDCLQHYT